MFNDQFTPPLSKDYIFKNNITEEAIFEKYLGIKPDYSEKFCNPLREDNNPSCGFYTNKHDRIKFADQGGGHNWDCFNVVEYLNPGVNFREILKIIAIDFGLLDGVPSAIHQAQERRRKEKVEIRIERRRDKKGNILWLDEDKEYWNDRYYQTRNDLAFFDTTPVEKAWWLRNGELDQFYYYKKGDPCYAYHLGAFDYQLYFPKREAGNRFRQSKGDAIQGLNQLPRKGHILFITKSRKDVMCVCKLGRDIGMYAIASMSETQLLSEMLIADLKLRFDYVFTLFDFDRAGIRLMRKYEDTYDIKGFLFGKEFKLQGIKDSADHLHIKRWDESNELIKRFYNEYIG